MTPLNASQVQEIEQRKSHYGCGASDCLACYPIQYACADCDIRWDEPIANNEIYQCPNCDHLNNGEHNG